MTWFWFLGIVAAVLLVIVLCAVLLTRHLTKWPEHRNQAEQISTGGRIKLDKPFRIAVVSLVSIAWLSFWPGWAYLNSRKPAIDPADISPQPWRPYWEEKHQHSPEQLAWIVPFVKKQACVKAEMAVRHNMRPPPDRLPVCGIDDHTEIDADLANVTVSGVALVGETKRPFTVKLQHYPPSVSESGLIVLSIDHGQNAPR
jgi:hypothetical protein